MWWKVRVLSDSQLDGFFSGTCTLFHLELCLNNLGQGSCAAMNYTGCCTTGICQVHICISEAYLTTHLIIIRCTQTMFMNSIQFFLFFFVFFYFEGSRELKFECMRVALFL